MAAHVHRRAQFAEVLALQRLDHIRIHVQQLGGLHQRQVGPFPRRLQSRADAVLSAPLSLPRSLIGINQDLLRVGAQGARLLGVREISAQDLGVLRGAARIAEGAGGAASRPAADPASDCTVSRNLSMRVARLERAAVRQFQRGQLVGRLPQNPAARPARA